MGVVQGLGAGQTVTLHLHQVGHLHAPTHTHGQETGGAGEEEQD